jgi:hypothetical protein
VIDPLPARDLVHRCDVSALDFDATAQLAAAERGPPLDLAALPGQQRALEALDAALGQARSGYNLLAVGEPGWDSACSWNGACGRAGATKRSRRTGATSTTSTTRRSRERSVSRPGARRRSGAILRNSSRT